MQTIVVVIVDIHFMDIFFEENIFYLMDFLYKYDVQSVLMDFCIFYKVAFRHHHQHIYIYQSLDIFIS